MSTSTRSSVPGSFGLTATRLRGASVPEISSADSIAADDRGDDRHVDGGGRGFGRGCLRRGFAAS